MIRMTDEAGSFLCRLLDEKSATQQSEACLRVAESRKGEFELLLGTMAEDDITLMHRDRVVIAIGPAVAARCQNLILDIMDKGDGTYQLVFVETPPTSSGGG
jgi:hypothetical protein